MKRGTYNVINELAYAMWFVSATGIEMCCEHTWRGDYAHSGTDSIGRVDY